MEKVTINIFLATKNRTIILHFITKLLFFFVAIQGRKFVLSHTVILKGILAYGCAYTRVNDGKRNKSNETL